MSDPEKKICRYFNTLGGCWYGDSCKFMHIPDKKPPCKFYGSSTGCRYGESCHFSHDRAPFKSVENYTNPPVELMKEVFKENVDPSELSGTNNNNMALSITTMLNSGQPGLTADGTEASLNQSANTMTNDFTLTESKGKIGGETVYTYETLQESVTNTVGNNNETADTLTLHSATATEIVASTTETATNNRVTSTVSVPLVPMQAIHEADNNQTTLPRVAQHGLLTESNITSLTKTDDGQNYAITTVNGRTNGMNSEIEIFCGSCKRILERRGNESYCTLLKDHYLECFLDKEGDHVKYVKTKAALEPGQMYWCKSCILIFEKPWSLFQHMADKAKGNKVQRWEKKIHLDWMDSVAGLMAGYDLGLFSPAKLRIDLRNLLADQHTMEEEMEAAAVTAAAMMQWLAPLSSPWRLQQREMMRKIEQLNRQMLRKANLGLNAASSGYSMRAALTGAPVSATTSPSINYMPSSRVPSGSLPTTPAPHREVHAAESRSNIVSQSGSTKPNTSHINEECFYGNAHEEAEIKEDNPTVEDIDAMKVGPLGDGNDSTAPHTELTQEDIYGTGASGDTSLQKENVDSITTKSEVEDVSNNTDQVDTNNTNSCQVKPSTNTGKNDDFTRRGDFKRGYSSAPTYSYAGSKTPHSLGFGSVNRGYNDSVRYQIHSRGSRTPGYGHPLAQFNSGYHRFPTQRTNRPTPNSILPPSRGANSFNPPSFHASMDFNCGFTDDEVEVLLSQGIRPWDSEAAAALAVLRGELDHLLD